MIQWVGSVGGPRGDGVRQGGLSRCLLSGGTDSVTPSVQTKIQYVLNVCKLPLSSVVRASEHRCILDPVEVVGLTRENLMSEILNFFGLDFQKYNTVSC